MNRYVLPSFLIVKVSTILEDVLKRLAILQSTNNYLIQHSNNRETGDKISQFQQLDKQFSHTECLQLSQNKKNYQKIINIEEDRMFIELCLLQLKNDIEINGEYTHFIQIITVEKQKEQRFDNQKETNEMYNAQIKTIEKSIEIYEREVNYIKQNLHSVRQQLIHQKQELFQKNKMQLQLAQSEVQQHLEDVQKICMDDILNIKNEMLKVLQLYGFEQKAYKSFVYNIRHSCVSLTKHEENFSKCYINKKEEVNEYINNVTKVSKEIKRQIIFLNNKYNEYLVVVEEDRIWKVELKNKEIKLNIQILNAKDIQKWWRWLIVKKGLLSTSNKKSKKKSKKKK